jgi:hypothetical protein
MGQQSALASDCIAFMDSLKIEIGHRRLRLRRADGEHRGRVVATAMQSNGVSERLSDRQPEKGQLSIRLNGQAIHLTMLDDGRSEVYLRLGAESGTRRPLTCRFPEGLQMLHHSGNVLGVERLC